MSTNLTALFGHWDPVRLARTICKLLNNAIKDSPRACDVGVSVRVEGGAAVLGVSDRGDGIVLTATDLSLVQHVVELHGGSVSMRREAETGTTVTTQLPLDA